MTLGFRYGWLIASVGLVAIAVSGLQPQVTVPPLPEPTPDQVTFFETRIRPVLAENCYSCHGDKVQMAGLRVDSRPAMTKGADAGPLLSMKASESLLVRVVKHVGPIKMPKGRKLKLNEIADLETWVAMGAPWPKTNGPKTATRAPLWSLRPVTNPAPPKVKNPKWVRNSIDAFVLSQLEARGLAPNPEADRRTLLRRVTFDLTGLPPTPAEVDVFLADKGPDAYERVVDRLLASPKYGERWARHWLDVARYADTKGYAFEEDRNYPNAYTFRDWVIRALNRDLPYDQFVKQQIAADLLPEVQQSDDKTPLAAMGFLTVGRRFLNIQPDIIDDRIDVAMRGLQGLTVACARCHDHKFDPVPTEDYYSLYGVFASTDEELAPISPPAIRNPWIAHNQKVSQAEAQFERTVRAEVSRLRKVTNAPAEIKAVLQGLREDQVPMGDNLSKLQKAFTPEATESLRKLDDLRKSLKAQAPPTPEFAMAMRDSSSPRDTIVFRRGNPGNPGPIAPRRYLAALAKAGKEREHWNKGSGRRQLAEAIASPENPLTARVFVNRVWQHHFGQAIVRTPSDFGYQGEKPTHPELLDHLAADFVASGWRIKRLHRSIVTSATYRQSSITPTAKANKDPENRWLSRMNRRRLDLEQMRDAMMLTSGQLDLAQTGGRSVDIWARPFPRRRTLYGFIERQNLPGVFRTFDFASPDSTSARRFTTTVPQQALFFMNSPFSVDQSRALADRPEIAKADSESQRVRRLYRTLFGRLPDTAELEASLAYLKLGNPTAPQPAWRYGYGSISMLADRLDGFTEFPIFTDGVRRPGIKVPDATFDYLLLTAGGGHPGSDLKRAVVRRWISPVSGTIQITGALAHPEKQGDGVRASLISSRQGRLGQWRAHGGAVTTNVANVSVQPGEILDFVVDMVGGPSFDSFAWAPEIRSKDRQWLAERDFASSDAVEPLSRVAMLAQALMMTNEFLFVD